MKRILLALIFSLALAPVWSATTTDWTNIRGKPIFNVVEFGATPNIDTDDDSTAFKAAIASAATVGGTVLVPNGQFKVDPNKLFLPATYTLGFTLQGMGPKATAVYCPTAVATSDIIIKYGDHNNTTSRIVIDGIWFRGPDGSSASGTAIAIDGAANARISNCEFSQVNTGILLGNVYYSKFQNLKFTSFITGITGMENELVSGDDSTANNNTFDTLGFTDPLVTAPISAKPINSKGMGYNTYIECVFESGGMETIDMDGGSGYDTLLNCRFEKVNSGGDNNHWLTLGNHQRVINCGFFCNGDYNVLAGGSDEKEPHLIYLGGEDSTVDIMPETVFAMNLVKLGTSARNNSVTVRNTVSADIRKSGSESGGNMVLDLGINNTVEFVGASTSRGNSSTVDCWSNGPVLNFASGSTTFSGWNVSNAVFVAATPTNTLEYTGPFLTGGSYSLAPDGLGVGSPRIYGTLTPTANYVYTFSIYVYCATGTNDIELVLGQDLLATATYRTVPSIGVPRWVRLAGYVTPSTNATLYFGIRISSGDDNIYVCAPQLEERLYTQGVVGPAAYVPTVTPYRVENCPRPLCHKWGTATPSWGTWYQGDEVFALSPASIGYTGWKCTVSGTPGTWKAFGAIAP